MWENSEIFMFPAVSSGAQGSSCTFQGWVRVRMGLGSAGTEVSVTAPPWVRLAGNTNSSLDMTNTTKPTCWIKGETSPAAQKLQDTKAAPQICLENL